MKQNTRDHRHGGDPSSDFKRFNLPVQSILDFSVNLNALGIPDVIRDHWPDLLKEIEHYPSLGGDPVARFLESKYGLAAHNCLAGNGSTELIYLLPRALGIKKVLLIEPSYHDYRRASTLAGAEIKSLPLTARNQFAAPDLATIKQCMQNMDALWLGNPNNPTGTLFTRAWLMELARVFSDKWIIIDEAFMPFVENHEQYSLLTPDMQPNVLVLASLTKFYALAGIRIGAIAGHGKSIARLRALKEPWTVNKIAEEIAALLPQCGHYEERSMAILKQEHHRLWQALKTFPGIAPFPAAANFILCQWKQTDDLDDLLRHLLENHIYIRDCRNFPGLEDGFFRLAIRLPGENDRLIAALTSFNARSHA